MPRLPVRLICLFLLLSFGAKLAPAADEVRIDFTVLLDSDGRVSKDWWVSGMPTTFVINAQGEIEHRIVGKREWDDTARLQLLRQLVDGN
jgi:peroxiredoxin